MRQCDIIRFLFQDLKESTSHLLLGDYHSLFEEEIKEHFPFNDEIQGWLEELYRSEKYNTLEGSDRSLFFEKSHPFLFVRDLATLNNWRMGYFNTQRRDQVTGLLFSMTEETALEATLGLCRPSLVDQKQSQWFDADKAMKNLELSVDGSENLDAWRGCAYYFLYMFFTSRDYPPSQGELRQMLGPFREAVDLELWKEGGSLKKECQIVDRALTSSPYFTVVDSVL